MRTQEKVDIPPKTPDFQIPFSISRLSFAKGNSSYAGDPSCSGRLEINASSPLRHAVTGADPGFEKGGFNLVPNSDTGGATNDDF